MPTTDTIHRVRIYIGEQDRWEGQPLYLAVLERLRREGATGATALRGLAGFGPGHRTRAAAPVNPNERPPVLIEWVDRAERIARTLSLFDDMLAEALITIEEVQIYRAVLRGRGRFAGDRSVGDIVGRDSARAVPRTATLGEVFTMLLDQAGNSLPVVDEQRRVVGIISDQEIAWRTGMHLPLRLLRLLTPEERNTVLTPLVGRPVAEVMNSELRSIYISAPIPQALVTMVEWNYDQLPVIDRDGSLMGLLSQRDVLRAAVEAVDDRNATVRNAEPATPVHLVMQSHVAQVPATSPLAAALAQLVAAPGGYLVVVDAAGRMQGCITDSGVLQRLAGAERAALLAALQHDRADATSLPGNDRGLEQVLERDIAAFAPTDSINDATRRLLELQLERAPVVDTDGKLRGLLAHGGLLRAFVQESE